MGERVALVRLNDTNKILDECKCPQNQENFVF
jgi:hypothetical protein